MTENEVLKTLEDLQRLLTNYRHISTELTEANGIAIQALEEIQAYRAIGTVEEVQNLKADYFEVVSEWRQYRKIGTVTELQALKEKAEPKKPIIMHEQVCDGVAEIEWECPVCGRKCVDIAPCPEWCSGCGTKFDWS